AAQFASWLDVPVRGAKLWMSNNPSALFNEYIGQPPDLTHFELWHDVLLEVRSNGATEVTFQLSTAVMDHPGDNDFLPGVSYNPPDASLLALAQDARSLGLGVTASFIVNVQNIITGSGGNDRPNPADRALWMQHYRTHLLDNARLAHALG